MDLNNEMVLKKNYSEDCIKQEECFISIHKDICHMLGVFII